MRPVQLATFAVAAALGPAAQAAPVAEVVPYSGFLDRDGTPADGAAALRFRIYNDANAVAAADADACNGGPSGCIWAEVHEAVPVRNGAFTVRLGAAPGDARRPIAPILRGREQLYLEVGVRNDADQRWVVLGRQSISPAPQAMFSLQPDIEVGTLNVLGETETETLHVRKIGNPGVFGVHDPSVVVGDPGGPHIELAAIGAAARTGGGEATFYLNVGAPTVAGDVTADSVSASRVNVTTVRFPSGATMSNLRTTSQDLQGGCCAADIRPVQNSICMLGGYGARDMGDDAGQSCSVGVENGIWKAYFSSYDANRWVSCRITCLVWE